MSEFPEGIKPDTKIRILGFPQGLTHREKPDANGSIRRRAEPNDIVKAKDHPNLAQCLKFGLCEVVEDEPDEKPGSPRNK